MKKVKDAEEIQVIIFANDGEEYDRSAEIELRTKVALFELRVRSMLSSKYVTFDDMREPMGEDVQNIVTYHELHPPTDLRS